MSKEKKSVWETLSAIDVNDKTEDKNGMTYLSWAWAWGKLKENYPEATFKKHTHDGMAYIKDEKGNAFVEVTVTVEGISATELFPVLNYNNKPIRKAKEVVDPIQKATPTPPPPPKPPYDSIKDDFMAKGIIEIDLDEVKEDWSMLTDAFHQLINAHESTNTLMKLWNNNKEARKLLKEKRPNDYQEVYEAFEKRGKYLKEKTNG